VSGWARGSPQSGRPHPCMGESAYVAGPGAAPVEWVSLSGRRRSLLQGGRGAQPPGGGSRNSRGVLRRAHGKHNPQLERVRQIGTLSFALRALGRGKGLLRTRRNAAPSGAFVCQRTKRGGVILPGITAEGAPPGAASPVPSPGRVTARRIAAGEGEAALLPTAAKMRS
jgi:hypothetical protein